MFAKQKLFEYRDKPSIYLAHVLAEEKEKPTFPDIMYRKDGVEVNPLQGKLKIISDYYEELFKSLDPKEENCGGFLDSIVIPKFTRDHSKLKMDKAPGLDGLRLEFYKSFKDLFIQHLQAFNCCLEDGRITESWKEVRLTLNPNKGKIQYFLSLTALYLSSIHYIKFWPP